MDQISTSNQLSIFDSIKNELKPEHIEVFKISYDIYEKYDGIDDCVIDLDEYIELIGYCDIKNFRNTILHKDYKLNKDYKEVSLDMCENLIVKKKR